VIEANLGKLQQLVPGLQPNLDQMKASDWVSSSVSSTSSSSSSTTAAWKQEQQHGVTAGLQEELAAGISAPCL
jgi:hypothetical protein